MDQWGILKGGKYFNVYAVGFITTTQNKNTELLICVLVIFMHCKNKTWPQFLYNLWQYGIFAFIRFQVMLIK